MFGVRGKIKYLADVVNNMKGNVNMLISEVGELKASSLSNKKYIEKIVPDIVTCADCGCAVVKDRAYKGESIIKQDTVCPLWSPVPIKGEPYIYTPILCKKCASKVATPPPGATSEEHF